MPIKVEIEGKGVVAEFPDGTDQGVIDSAIKRDYFSGQKTPIPGIPVQFNNPEEMNPLQEFGVGMGYGMNKLLNTGVRQRGAQVLQFLGLTDPSTVQNIEKEVSENRRIVAPFTNRPKSVTRPMLEKGQWVDQVSPLGNPFKIGETIGEIAATAPIPGGAGGGAMKRILTGAAAGATAGALEPTLEGESSVKNAAFGAGAGGLVSGGMSLVSRFYNALTGNTLKNEVTDLSSKYGVRASLGEITDNPITKKLETWLEGVPLIGMKRFRKNQNAEAEELARGFFARYTVDPSLASTAEMKAANEAFLDTLYDQVRVSGAQLPRVTADETKATTSSLLQNFPGVFDSIQDQRVKKILKNISRDVSDKGTPPDPVITPDFSFTELWELRKGLGRELRDAKTATAEGELKSLYHAVSDDMDTMFSMSGTQAGATFKEANDQFKRLNVKFDVLRQVYDKAVGTTGPGEMFSPKKFSTDLKNLANKPEYKKWIKWDKNEVEEMTGIANILETVKRSGQFKENPPTGNRWGLPVVAAELTQGGYVLAAKAAGLTGIATFLTATRPGKALVLAASKIEADSPAMQKLIDQLYNQLPKAGANVSVNENRVPIPEPGPDYSKLNVPDWQGYLQ